MTNRYEQRCAVELAYRLATHFPARSAVARELSDWAENQDLGFSWDPDQGWARRKGVPAEAWGELRALIAQQVARPSRAQPDRLTRNSLALAAYVRLDQDETRIFVHAVRSVRDGPINSLCSALISDAQLPVEDIVVHLTGLSSACVHKALSPSGRLMATGLLQFDKKPFGGVELVPSRRLLSALETPSRGLEDVLGNFFARVEPASVVWEDLDHLGPGRDFAFRLLRGALESREKGVNILLHGAPGTGKTELCKLLAARLGAELQAVGEADDNGDEPSRSERLQQLRLGQRLLADQGNSIILFDEMEDLFPGMDGSFLGLSPRRSGSKIHMNRLLEGNPVPTLWTTNNISDCGPAFLRRITFTLELRTPPVPVRARVWQKLAEQHRIALPQELCLELAQSMEDAPALANSALRAASIARGDSDDVKLAATAISRAVRGGHVPLVSYSAGRFEPELANADHDLNLITERLVACGPANTGGLCLSGPPGTGKSAFARHLAEQLHMPVLERRASDLLDCYVGGSERNIAAAFAEARDTRAFLVFDEADSLLGARDGASHRWEISQVNEMLTWMESHPLPFACTTNLVAQLDPATARRFSLRIGFQPLGLEQRRACFQRFFEAHPPEDLRALDQLTPGDFAVVAKRIALLGITEPGAIMVELRREQASKPDTQNPIGFRAAS